MMPSDSNSFYSLENIIKYLPEHVYWLDRNNIILGCNELQAKTLGVKSIEDVKGKTLYDFYTEETASQLIMNNNQVMCSGIGCTIEEEVIQNNDIKYYLSKKIPLKDDQNNTIGLLGMSFDITERKLYEQNIIAAKKQAEVKSNLTQIYLDNILLHLPEHFYWMDKEGRIIGCNEKQAKTFGFDSAKELIGKNIYDVAERLGWKKDVPDSVRKNDIEVMETGKSIVSEETGLINGKKTTFLVYKNPLIDNCSNIIGVFGIAIDITERKEVEEAYKLAKEQAEQSNQAKNEFISNMSHDLRTPFTGILGLSQILALREQDLEKKELLNEIANSTQNLLTLLNEILDISSIENADRHIQISRFDIYELVDSIKTIFLPEAKRKSLNFIINYLGNIPKYVIGDKLKLNRILLNLVGNALKFTDKGQVCITIESSYAAAANIMLVIKIEDTGIGIPFDKQNVIFDKFTRLTSSHSNKYHGIGLGLYIVGKFIQDMNGSISIESEVGKGAKFTCTLPFEISHY